MQELASYPEGRRLEASPLLVRLGKRAWLHCDGYRHSIMIEPHELAQQYRLDMLTSLLTITRRMRCSRCLHWRSDFAIGGRRTGYRRLDPRRANCPPQRRGAVAKQLSFATSAKPTIN
jgi:hypothetical protein